MTLDELRAECERWITEEMYLTQCSACGKREPYEHADLVEAALMFTALAVREMAAREADEWRRSGENAMESADLPDFHIHEGVASAGLNIGRAIRSLFEPTEEKDG